MNEKKKIQLGWLAFLFLTLHFGLISIYCGPNGLIPSKVKEISSYYVVPVFEQDWSMFAPCPTKDFSIRFKYFYHGGKVKDWIRPAENAIFWHNIFRFTHHGEIVLAEANVLYWLDVDIEKLGIDYYQSFPEEKTSELKKSPSWNLLSRYAYGCSNYLFGEFPVSAEVELTMFNAIDKTSGVLILPDLKWN